MEAEFLTSLLDKGITASMGVAVLWVVIKKLIGNQDLRIAALEEASAECNKDRTDLHNQIFNIQKERIQALEEELS